MASFQFGRLHVYKCLLMCYCCIIATEEDHHSVVETFGEEKEFLGTFMQASVEHSWGERERAPH